MRIVQTPFFKRSYKKLHTNHIKSVDDAIRHILSDLLCGEEKKGDLSGVRVYKFRILNEQFLLAYEHNQDTFFCLPLVFMRTFTEI